MSRPSCALRTATSRRLLSRLTASLYAENRWSSFSYTTWSWMIFVLRAHSTAVPTNNSSDATMVVPKTMRRTRRSAATGLPSRRRQAVLVLPHGNSRMRSLRKRIGEPSLSRQRYPVAGSQPVPPETSSPLTQRRTSPLMPRM